MIKTGDRVFKIEGVISGTLNYIFNELAKGRLFSDVVMEAKRLGVTEPDPREDLSGMDVARKLVCLAREIGEFIKIGMTPMQAIQAGTIVNAQLLHKEKEIGSIEVGKWADIIAVKGDPLKDITELQKVKFVMIGGKIIKKEK